MARYGLLLLFLLALVSGLTFLFWFAPEALHGIGFATQEGMVTRLILASDASPRTDGTEVGIELIRLGSTEVRQNVVVHAFLRRSDGTVTSLTRETVLVETRAATFVTIPPTEDVSGTTELVVEVRDLTTNELLSTASQRLIQAGNVSLLFSPRSISLALLVALFLGVIALVLFIITLFRVRHALTPKRHARRTKGLINKSPFETSLEHS